ncbi:Tryp_alpha_amyl domain-containing protein [Cephalotus follicularis]|uniref:Non-specific lipid-transfer protein n=1 Tax=Cephalotus follicularis TaxID=3775 RepID=A0A1Q3CAC0_CEPFO|nr:Tryp_alpha_amyl domain-containing protein [Cephalotus follicularis]
MAGISIALKLACAVVMCLLLAAPLTQLAPLTCGQVDTPLEPCLNYLRNTGPLTSECCAGVKKINAEANTTANRKAACKCLKTLAAEISGINFTKAADIPTKCDVKVPDPISLSTDCNKVK